MSRDQLVSALQSEGIEATPARFVGDAVSLDPGSLGRLSDRLARDVLVQDEGSQLVARAAGVRPGERVLDACASPGGKTLVLAADLDLAASTTGSRLVAADRRPGRIALLGRTLRRANLPIPIVALDARAALPFGPVFDCVVIDAPCSGLGTLRRDPDIKWARRVDDLARLAADQLLMLTAAAESVRPGGRLVYATCSGEPEENTGVVDAFLRRDARYTLASVDRETVPAELVDERGCLSTAPFRDGLDAFFAAVLVRRPAT
jgi:16S rRNA (cytosine967-C5)-methyltransferase